MRCPICKKKMLWKEGLLDGGGSRDPAVGRYYCLPCGVAGKMTESRGIKEGRKRVNEFKGVDVLDKRMLALPTAVQIGILRERQKRNESV